MHCQDNHSTGGSKMQAKAKLRLVPPTHQNRTMPLRPVNADLRKREYLTPHEIEKLLKTAKRSGKTDAQGQRNVFLCGTGLVGIGQNEPLDITCDRAIFPLEF